MKLVRLLIVFWYLYCCCPTIFAQTHPQHQSAERARYSIFLSVLSDMPGVFRAWVNQINNIEIDQNRDKFAHFTKELASNVTVLINDKTTILNKLNSGVQQSDAEWDHSIKNMNKSIQRLKMTLDSTNKLTKQRGLADAQVVSNRLSIDFHQKDFLFSLIIRNHEQGKIDKLKKNFKTAIDTLNSVSKILEHINSKLQ